MNKLLIKKGEEYTLTPEGEYLAYLQSIYSLSIHYIRQLFPQKLTPQFQREFHSFLKKECPSIEDFLKKLPSIAQFIGEKDPQRFTQYISKHFTNYLEKVRKNLIQKELPRVKAYYEDPYKTPGKELLFKYEDIFQKAPPLNSSSSSEKKPTPEAPLKEKKVPPPSSKEILPGERLLTLYKDFFKKAPPLGKIDTQKKEEKR